MGAEAELRRMVDADCAMVLAWRNTPSVRENMYTYHEITLAEHTAWWQRVKTDASVVPLILEMGGEPVGFVSFTAINPLTKTASWAFYSGNVERRGVGREMERLALQYAFDHLQLDRLECEVLSFNEKVIDFHVRHGFKIEGRRRRAYVRDAKAHDIVQLGVLRSEWEGWIRDAMFGTARSLAGRSFEWSVVAAPEDIDAFARASSDMNPVHLDGEAALAAGFAGRIAHGMWLGARLSAYFANEFPGPGTIYVAQSLRFLRPVAVGSAVEFRCRVMSHFKRRVELATLAEVAGELVASGSAELVLPSNFVAGAAL